MNQVCSASLHTPYQDYGNSRIKMLANSMGSPWCWRAIGRGGRGRALRSPPACCSTAGQFDSEHLGESVGGFQVDVPLTGDELGQDQR